MKFHKGRVIVGLFFLMIFLLTVLYNVSSSDVNAETNKDVVFEFKNSTETIKLSQNVGFNSKIRKKNLPKDSEIEWYSSDEDIASISEKGYLAGLQRGKVEIKAVLKGTNYSTSCTVEVVPNTLNFYLKDSSKKITSYKCEKGEILSIKVNDEFNSVKENELIYSSSNEDVATVDQNGNITTKIAGKTTITATLAENKKISKKLNLEVTTAVNELKVYDDTYDTYVGDKSQIDFEVFPSNATNKNVKYVVENKQVASVSSNGKIQGKKSGTTTITMISKSNPEIKAKVNVNVSGQREYRLVESSQISQTEEYIVKYVNKGETIKIKNNYSEDLIIKCKGGSLIDYEVTKNYINITGLERGVAFLEITDNGVVDNIKVLVNKYIDDETKANIIPVNKIILPTKESDLIDGMDYINDTSIDVGETWLFKYYISPIDASIDDLQYSISNEDDFSLSTNGKITAINPNKTTKLTVSSKSDPSVTKTITLRSDVGEVESVEFARKYIGENSLDINKSESFPFNPIFRMESGKVFDPTMENLNNNETYKKLLNNVKIRTSDSDLIKISNNKAYPIKNTSGMGELELLYNEGKYNEKRATTSFESNGFIREAIKSIRFAKSNYQITEGGEWNFNPIIVTNTNKTYDPQKAEVRESQEYKNLLSKIQLEKVEASNGYLGTGNLVRIISNNGISVVYEGKCKLKMVVTDTDISTETILDINFNKDIEKNVNGTRYIGANSVILVSDKNNPSSTGVKEVSKGTQLYAYEKFKDGWVRVKYNGNDKLYVKASNLTEEPPKINNASDDVEKNINGYRYIGKNNVKLSPPAGTGDDISVPISTKIYVFEKFKNGWVRVKYDGNDNLYVEAKNLTNDPPKITSESNTAGIVIADTLNVRSSPDTAANNIVGTLYSGSTVSIIKKSGNWYLISYNGSQAYVNADYIRERTSSNTSTSLVPTSDNEKVQAVLNEAVKYLGVPYVWGGTTPAGFDCSGYVQYVLAQCGISVNRTTYDQWPNDGVFVKKSELQPGDLVYFGPSNAPTHVGIYVGNNTMIHSPSTGKSIMYLNIDYFSSTCIGGKRVIP